MKANQKGRICHTEFNIANYVWCLNCPKTTSNVTPDLALGRTQKEQPRTEGFFWGGWVGEVNCTSDWSTFGYILELSLVFRLYKSLTTPIFWQWSFGLQKGVLKIPIHKTEIGEKQTGVRITSPCSLKLFCLLAHLSACVLKRQIFLEIAV